MAQMKLIPADNMKDKLWGIRGTPEREAMEAKLKEDVNAYIVGEAIRKARLAQNLTQEQLGERIGVQRAQISKLEKGTSVITLPTMSRVYSKLWVSQQPLLIWVLQARLRCGKMTVRLCNLGRIV